MATERILVRDEEAYEKMRKVAKMMTLISPNNKTYYVDDTYLDFGQDWMWTTIIRADRDWGGVQVLSPKDWQDIVCAEDGFELAALTLDIMNDKWFGDKKKEV